MKKAVALILIALPIVLMVFISLAGSLLGVFGTIKAESIIFVNESGELITEDIVIGIDQEYQLKVEVLPEKASDKTVRFFSESEVIEITEDGLVTAIDYGSARVSVVSADGRITEWITVVVSDRKVTGVSLNREELTVKIGSMQTLKAIVYPSTAENKIVIWSSSDPEKVNVTSGGELLVYALTEPDEPVVITVETEDGGFTAECLVTVIDATEFIFVKKGESIPVRPDEDIIIREASVDLLDYVKILTEEFDGEDISFSIESGSRFAELNGSILSFNQSGTVVIRAETETGGEVFFTKAHFRYNKA